MEIGSTILQGLARAITGHEQSASQSAVFPGAGSSADRVDHSMNGSVASDRARVDQAGDDNSILTSNEREIIDLFFGDREEINLALYGSRPPTPVALGNFIDVRG